MAIKPFFVPQGEIDLFDALNEELIDEIIGNYVDIYKVSIDDTTENIYGESSTKYFEKGFRVNCLVSFVDPTIEQDDLGPDFMSAIEMFFHRTTLEEAGFYPEIGDIVYWNSIYWEINHITEPQLIAGHPAFTHSIKAIAHRMRISNLQIEERPK